MLYYVILFLVSLVMIFLGTRVSVKNISKARTVSWVLWIIGLVLLLLGVGGIDVFVEGYAKSSLGDILGALGILIISFNVGINHNLDYLTHARD